MSFLSSPGPSPSPCPNRPPSQITKKKEGFGPWADSKITWATQLLSMKECSGNKVQKMKVAQNNPLTNPAKKIDQMDSENKDVG